MLKILKQGRLLCRHFTLHHRAMSGPPVAAAAMSSTRALAQMGSDKVQSCGGSGRQPREDSHRASRRQAGWARHGLRNFCLVSSGPLGSLLGDGRITTVYWNICGEVLGHKFGWQSLWDVQSGNSIACSWQLVDASRGSCHGRGSHVPSSWLAHLRRSEVLDKLSATPWNW